MLEKYINFDCFYFHKDHRCGDKQFTCKNGECVKNNLLCDGDFACKDESDEDDCECPSNMFTCQGGKCLPATDVCDGINDCPYGDDENNCRKYTSSFLWWFRVRVRVACTKHKKLFKPSQSHRFSPFNETLYSQL